MKKFIKLALGIVLAILFLWLVFRRISLDEIKDAFSNTKPLLLVAAVVFFYIGYSCRIERWRLMLNRDNPKLGWRNCAGPLMASVAANNVLPFRSGDLLRAFGFNRRLGVSAATSATSLVVERLLDLLMVAAFLGIALAYFGMESSSFLSLRKIAMSLVLPAPMPLLSSQIPLVLLMYCAISSLDFSFKS